MSDVFISYAKEDRERARTIATALQERGWSVWWDRDIKAGQTFDLIIENELDTAKSVVVLWSNHAVASEWVKNEAATASERGVLIPVMIDDVKLPLEFRRRQTADLIGWAGNTSSAGFQALCTGIAAIVALPSPSLVDSTARTDSRFRRNQTRAVTWVAAIAVLLAGAVYVGAPYLRRQSERPEADRGSAPIAPYTGRSAAAPGRATSAPPEPQGRSAAAFGRAASAPPEPQATSSGSSDGFGVGTFEFKWPGGDCWDVYRGQDKVVSGCGTGKQALQAGNYTVKPLGNSRVFLPFSVAVKPNLVSTADAMGGIFEFKWPGSDCWDVYRGQDKVVSGCGTGRQALEAGTYTVKPLGRSAVFQAFNVQVTRGQTTTRP
jgi:hypothetical protein